MGKKNKEKELYLGIDLGTTNSLVAVVDGSGIVKVIPNIDGDQITQSLVSVAGEQPVVGKAAKPDRFLNPEMTAELFKRYMHMEPLPTLVTSPDGSGYTPVMLSAEVMYFLKQSAEKLEGCKFKKAVIGVPAYFENPARQATKEAALIAGFEEVYIVDEPTLAATHYELAKGETAKIAVFDFGGGTFDISIIDVKEGGEIEPKAVDGDPECGGTNIDEAVFQVVRDHVQEKGGQLSPDEDRADWLEALDACKEAKETLSRKDSTVIPLRIGNERTSMEITYEQLKEYSAPVIETLKQGCRRALKKAGLEPSEINKVVLVGGSTRLRFVHDVVQEVFGQEPVGDTDPDLAVVKGAAIVAAAHYGKPDGEIIVDGKIYLASSVKPRPIAPRDLCVAAITKEHEGDIDEYNVPIITANSKLPYEATKCFTPYKADATSVCVKLYDGHAGKRSKDCKPLHEVDLEVQPTNKANNTDRIEFKINMDVEGLVHIKVRDKVLNKPVPITFKFHTGLSEGDIQEKRSQLLARHN